MNLAFKHNGISSSFLRLVVTALVIGRVPQAIAQSRTASALDSTNKRWIAPVTILGDNDEKARTAQLRDPLERLSMFRSTSSLTAALPGDTLRLRAAVVLPRINWIHNKDLPYSINDGALWAGRGTNADVTFGARAEWKNVRLFLLPELVQEANKTYDTTHYPVFDARRSGRNDWSSPFHTTEAQSIDLPIGFGVSRITKVYPGQSTITATTRFVEFGAGTENEWWGPGIRNALLLSNNAPGFGRFFMRTARPLMTSVGAVEARWMAGGLTESDYFDENPRNNLRSIAMLGATLQPKLIDGLTVGAARSVFGPVTHWWSALTNFADVFHDVGQPNAVPRDSMVSQGSDQLLSFFMHWVLPSDGFEAYAEWGRAEFPKTLRDYLVEPNRSQGYTVGLQWLGKEVVHLNGRLRVQAEATFVEQSPNYNRRLLGSWYTSAKVIQGYTQQGQTLGAAIGPGSSSQWTALDFLRSSWSVGGYLTRIRWLEDARSQAFPPDKDVDGWCEHDVSLLGGVRAHGAGRFGELSADYSSGWRYNVFFQHGFNSCPQSTGTDIRTHSLSVRFAPAFARW